MTGRRGWRVFAVLLAGALAAALLAPDQLAAWAAAHADRPGGTVVATMLDGWNALVSPLGGARRWVHGTARDVVGRQF